VNILIIDNNQ